MGSLPFPLDFLRQFEGPLDHDLKFDTYTLMIDYLSSPRRYAGQIVSANVGGTMRAYMINAAKDGVVQLAQGATTSITIDNTLKGDGYSVPLGLNIASITSYAKKRIRVNDAGDGFDFYLGLSKEITVGASGADFTDIQSAIDYAVTQSPSDTNRWEVKVGPGTYTITTGITCAQYVSVVGSGTHATIITYTTDITGITCANDMLLAHLSVKPTTENGSNYAIYTGTTNVKLDSLFVYGTNVGRYGFHVTGGNVDMINCIAKTYEYALVISAPAAIKNCIFYSTNNHTVLKYGATDVRITDCFISGPAEVISVGGSGITIIENTVVINATATADKGLIYISANTVTVKLANVNFFPVTDSQYAVYANAANTNVYAIGINYLGGRNPCFNSNVVIQSSENTLFANRVTVHEYVGFGDSNTGRIKQDTTLQYSEDGGANYYSIGNMRNPATAPLDMNSYSINMGGGNIYSIGTADMAGPINMNSYSVNMMNGDIYSTKVATFNTSAAGNMGSDHTFDFSTGTFFSGTLDDDCSIIISNLSAGQRGQLTLYYSGAQRTNSWYGVDKWLTDEPTTGPASGKVQAITLINDDVNVIGAATDEP